MTLSYMCFATLQITSVNIKTPCLTKTLTTRLSSALESFINLKDLTISNPTRLDSLSQLSSIGSLKFTGLPSSYEDWQWLHSAQKLTELEVSVAGEITDSGRLHVLDGAKAELSSTADLATISMLVKVLFNVPINVSVVEATVSNSKNRTCHLCISGRDAELTNIDQEEMAVCMALILDGLPSKIKCQVGPSTSNGRVSSVWL